MSAGIDLDEGVGGVPLRFVHELFELGDVDVLDACQAAAEDELACRGKRGDVVARGGEAMAYGGLGPYELVAPGQGLGHLARRLLGRAHDVEVATERLMDGGRLQRVVRAALLEGVDVGAQLRIQARAHGAQGVGCEEDIAVFQPVLV